MEEANFRRGNEQLDEMLAMPGMADKVAAIQRQNRNNDRAYKMRLAMIREAADLTQAELADCMKSTQGVVSKLERSDNMLLQTLHRYLSAAGAEDVRIVVSMQGQDIEVDLDSVKDDAAKHTWMSSAG
jgi:ribosome-binding protein aMBF1 (putative translation factor)